MRLKITLVPDFVYTSRVREFPIDIEISTDVPTEIDSRIEVDCALLTKPGEEEACFGFVQRRFRIKHDFVPFLPEAPQRRRIDVFKDLDDFEDYLPGTYLFEIKVVVIEQIGEKRNYLELFDTVEVVIT